jgi:hypothetical protein
MIFLLLFVHSCLRRHFGRLSAMELLQRWPHRPVARQQLGPRLFTFRQAGEVGFAVAQAGPRDAVTGLQDPKSNGVAANDDAETGFRVAK